MTRSAGKLALAADARRCTRPSPSNAVTDVPQSDAHALALVATQCRTPTSRGATTRLSGRSAISSTVTSRPRWRARGGGLEPDVAGAHDHQPPARPRGPRGSPRRRRSCAGSGCPPGRGRAPRAGAAGCRRRAAACRSAARRRRSRRRRCVGAVDGRDPHAEARVHLPLLVELRAAQQQALAFHFARQELLRQRRPVVGQVGLVAHQHDRALVCPSRRSVSIACTDAWLAPTMTTVPRSWLRPDLVGALASGAPRCRLIYGPVEEQVEGGVDDGTGCAPGCAWLCLQAPRWRTDGRRPGWCVQGAANAGAVAGSARFLHKDTGPRGRRRRLGFGFHWRGPRSAAGQ